MPILTPFRRTLHGTMLGQSGTRRCDENAAILNSIKPLEVMTVYLLIGIYPAYVRFVRC